MTEPDVPPEVHAGEALDRYLALSMGDVRRTVQILFEWGQRSQASLSETSDRALAIVSATWLDTLLSRMLKVLFIEHASIAGLLDGETARFSAHDKIELSHALGIISETTRHDLMKFNRIRNQFAYRVEVSSFDHADIAALITRMHCIERLNVAMFDEAMENRHRLMFGLALQEIVVVMADGARHIKRLERVPASVSIDRLLEQMRGELARLPPPS